MDTASNEQIDIFLDIISVLVIILYYNCMPKIKTSSSLKKRFKLTATGKVKRWKSGWGHYKTKRSAEESRALRKSTYISSSDPRAKVVKMRMPYN